MMNHRNAERFVVAGFAAVLACELVIHWGLKSNLSPTLRQLYLSDSKLNSITMALDNFAPAAMIGFVNGWFGHGWTTRKLNVSAIVVAGGVTLAQVLYSMFFPKQLLWWWPPQVGEGLVWFATATVFSLFFSHLGRNVRITKQGRSS